MLIRPCATMDAASSASAVSAPAVLRTFPFQARSLFSGIEIVSVIAVLLLLTVFRDAEREGRAEKARCEAQRRPTRFLGAGGPLTERRARPRMRHVLKNRQQGKRHGVRNLRDVQGCTSDPTRSRWRAAIARK